MTYIFIHPSSYFENYYAKSGISHSLVAAITRNIFKVTFIHRIGWGNIKKKKELKSEKQIVKELETKKN